MLSMTRITDALPVDTNNFIVTPADFKDVPFVLALLLPTVLDVVILAHEEFLKACEAGYDDYFSAMYDDEGEAEVFVDRFYTWDEVKQYIIKSVFPDAVDIAYCSSFQWESTSLAWRVGFVLGWLSALGLTDRSLALYGVDLLVHLAHLQLMALTFPCGEAIA